MSNIQIVYNIFRNAGMTDAGILGMLGNFDCESNVESCRVQGDFSANRTASRDYVARVTSGALSKEGFAGDSRGFGFAQWTLAYRKRKLWEFWKASGRALDDPTMQASFALSELRTEGEYSGLFQMLKTSDNLYACVEAVCKNYERPAYNNIDARYQSAKRIQGQINTADSDGEEIIVTAPGGSDAQTPAIMPTHEFWPPRVICEGMKGPDVEVLCALLKAQEYGINYITAEFGSFLTEKVKTYQTAKSLKPDGIVGPLTWGALLKTDSL